jgi:hypothetical protein
LGKKVETLKTLKNVYRFERFLHLPRFAQKTLCNAWKRLCNYREKISNAEKICHALLTRLSLDDQGKSLKTDRPL